MKTAFEVKLLLYKSLRKVLVLFYFIKFSICFLIKCYFQRNNLYFQITCAGKEDQENIDNGNSKDNNNIYDVYIYNFTKSNFLVLKLTNIYVIYSSHMINVSIFYELIIRQIEEVSQL